MSKLGSWIDTTDVIPNGGAAHLHAVDDSGARRRCGNGTIHLTAVDSALVSVGSASAFPTPLDPLAAAAASRGIHAVLANNYWGTFAGWEWDLLTVGCARGFFFWEGGALPR